MQLRAGTFLHDRYEILGCIGSGGMSYVYKARDHKLNRLVAVKVLKEEFSCDDVFVGKFKIEAQSAAGLVHPNVVNVYDVVDEGELHYIIMELVEGITLKHFIESKGKLDVNEAAGISVQIARGIYAAHQIHVIHRDIKPQNVIISADGKVKVADFGIARAAASDTLTTTAMGSVHYISPEQARGESSDERSDIYSLGITMYEMVTGRTPFDGDSPVSIAISQIEDTMPLPSSYNPSIPPEFEKIIMKCCQKKPERRYRNVQDLIADLRVLIDSSTVPGNSPSADSPTYETRVITPEEMGEINTHLRQNNRNNRNEDRDPGDNEDRKSTRNEKIIAILGIVIAVIIVAVLIAVVPEFLAAAKEDTANFRETLENGTTKLSDTQTYVPDVIGLSMELGEKKLEDSMLMMNIRRYEPSDRYEKDIIISQDPLPDEVTDKYTYIDVIVSSGSSEGSIAESEPESAEETEEETTEASDLTKVPSIVGLTEIDAIGVLADSHLVPGSVTTAYDETIPTGAVISQGVLAGSDIEKGAAIGYVVSMGSNASGGKYYASVKTTYNLKDRFGPGSGTEKVEVMARIHQVVDGEDVYTTLMEPRSIKADTQVPLNYDFIEGAEGVETGTLEVCLCENGVPVEVVRSYDLEFFKQ